MDDFESGIARIAGSTRRVRDQMTTIEEATTEMKSKEITLKRQKTNIQKTKEVLDENRAVIRDAETVIIAENNTLSLLIAPLLTEVLSTLGEMKDDIKDIKDDVQELKRGQRHLANSISFINDKTFETMPFVDGTIPATLPEISCIADITALTEAQVQSFLRGYGKPDNGEEWKMKRELAILHGVSRSFANTLFKAPEESNEDSH